MMLPNPGQWLPIPGQWLPFPGQTPTISRSNPYHFPSKGFLHFQEISEAVVFRRLIGISDLQSQIMWFSQVHPLMYDIFLWFNLHTSSDIHVANWIWKQLKGHHYIAAIQPNTFHNISKQIGTFWSWSITHCCPLCLPHGQAWSAGSIHMMNLPHCIWCRKAPRDENSGWKGKHGLKLPSKILSLRNNSSWSRFA